MHPTPLLLVLLLAAEPDAQPLRSTISPAEVQHQQAVALAAFARWKQQQHLTAQAEKHYATAAQLDPDAVTPKRELAKIYASFGRETAARELAAAVVAADPTDVEMAELLGRLHRNVRRYPEAVAAYQLAWAAAGKLPTTKQLLILQAYTAAAREAGDTNAEATAELAALTLLTVEGAAILKAGTLDRKELDNQTAKHHEALGLALVKQGKPREAAGQFRAALAIYALGADAASKAGVLRQHSHRARTAMQQQDDATAMAEQKKYLAGGPSTWEPYRMYAEILAKLPMANAVEEFRDLAAANPANPAPQWFATAAQNAAGQSDAADTAFRKLLIKMAKPEEAELLVGSYTQARRLGELVQHLDRTFKASRPPGYNDPDRDKDIPLDDAKPEAQRRTALLGAAVRSQFHRTPGALVQQLQRTTPTNADIFEVVLSLNLSSANLELIASLLQEAVRTNPKDIHLKVLTVVALRELRDWTTLVRVADGVSRAEAGRYYPSIKAERAFAFAELGQRRQAFDVLNEMGDQPSFRLFSVQAYVILGNYEEAAALCREILQLERLTADQIRSAKLKLAECLAELGKSAEAERLLRDLLDDHPDDTRLLNSLGYSLAEQHRKLPEARKLVERALALDTDERRRQGDVQTQFGGILDSLGWVLFQQGEFKAAKELLKQATSSQDQIRSPIAWDHLGDALFRLKERAAAKDAWQRAEELYGRTHLGVQRDRLTAVRDKLKLVR